MIMDRINKFRGEYYFLSNFYEAPVTYDGVTYANNEAAFQAQKVVDPESRRKWAGLPAGIAKKYGRTVPLRPDWEDVKVSAMEGIVRAKFLQNPDLARKLLATGEAELVEGNTWRDRFWGVDAATGEGRNELGKILMKVRSELRAERQ